MLTYIYKSRGVFELIEKPKPKIQHERDAVVKVTLFRGREALKKILSASL